MVDVASFMMRKTSEKQIDFAYTSPFGGGRPGRVKRKNEKNNKGAVDEDGEE